MGQSRASRFADSCRRKNFFKTVLFPIFKIMIFSSLFVFALEIATQYMTFPGKLVKIEQLRKEIETMMLAKRKVPDKVMERIIEWNIEISSHKRYNSFWWSDFIHHNGWNDVALIVTLKH